jgi:hypothetical protein
MVLEVDNKGVVDLANNWSVGGCTRHISVCPCEFSPRIEGVSKDCYMSCGSQQMKTVPIFSPKTCLALCLKRRTQMFLWEMAVMT